ncbi:hypothetical protein AMS68_006355 [Peltaster fructicola]|uniref:VASt domain-containing protein n=1 Tax=Peltaster fructicola TaxID=286661 RepID=A0A6H0Y1V7_9PEZI|nr:hypothetical protein AMS68_006355 [Peltaster fructicola]
MSGAELQTPSPRGIGRLRRNRAAVNQSTSSLVSSTSTTDNSNEASGDGNGNAGGLKASFSNVMGRVRKSIDDRRESVDDESVSPQRRLSTMFKRKKNRGDNTDRRPSQQLDDSTELALQDSNADVSPAPGSRHSSLFTNDTVDDESDAVRPTLSAHPSHLGFLTLSSPAVNAETQAETPADSTAEPVGSIASQISSIVEPHHEDSGEELGSQSRSALPAAHRKSESIQSEDTATGESFPSHPITRIVSEPVEHTETSDSPATPRHTLRITTAEPETPPGRPQTPQTFVTPPTPVIDTEAAFDKRGDTSGRRRRALSNGASSKLSRSINTPLTPTVEEAKTPGGSIVQPTNATGFFSSILTTAQKAADQLTSTIQASAPAKNRDSKELSDTQSVAASDKMRSTSSLVQSREVGTDAKTEEEAAAARAVSAAYDKPAAGGPGNGRPTSINSDRLTIAGDHSPPQHDDEPIKRAGSVRSRLSGRRHRGSSAATGSAIVATLKETASGLTHTGTAGQSHRMTGFAVASKKRNKDFHTQFRSVPEDDYLIEDYSAALQKDILLHGRLYVSEGHICFSSNILGWVTNLVMSFDEIVAIEKEHSSHLPNALVIQTLHAKNTFASFVARDSTYELIVGIWKINHPHLKSSLNGVALEDAGTGDKTEKADSDASDRSDTESDDEFYDEDEDDDARASYVEGDTTRSVAGSDVGDNTLNHKSSGAPVGGSQPELATKAREVNDSAAGNSTVANTDSLGPDTHAPTECGDTDKHYDRPLTDTTIAAPLGKIYSLMWGPGSGAFMSKWLVDDQKSRELDLKDDKIGLDNSHKEVVFSYIKPLGGSIGPKQTKCITTNTLELFDLEKAVIVSCSTQTPDVPSGNVFATKTKYCLMWGPNNSTRMIANCTIEWSGKSWLKGPIEKGAQDGQTQYVKDIVAALNAAVSPKTAAKGPPKKGKKKGKKDDEDDTAKEDQAPATATTPAANWGPLEPLRGVLEPVVGVIRPFLAPQVVIAVLFVLLVYTWIAPPTRGTGVGFRGPTSPERIAAYEQLWRHEESELWDWLEDRVGLDDGYAANLAGIKQRQKVVAARELGKQLDNEKMSGRQLDEAIRTTEERLSALKQAVQEKKKKVKAVTESET